tara:strand:+ start:21280 stop:21459 length:180 start_codon:yes stop_codon:yes gene_type:complete
MQKPTETADQERIQKWQKEDYWNRMDFNPAWIFILPAVLVGFALATAYLIVHYLIPISL